jgi:hypothetical protein
VAAVEAREEFHEPLELCADCLARLDSHSLRPLEWYNLCAVHGSLSELLGEEYYDEADGRALAPAEEVADADAPRVRQSVAHLKSWYELRASGDP